MPSRRVSVLLVAVFFGFGWVLGDLSGSPRTGTLAAARGPARIKLMLPADLMDPTQTTASGAVPPPTTPAATPLPGGSESGMPPSRGSGGAHATQGTHAAPTSSEAGGESGSGTGGEGTSGTGEGGSHEGGGAGAGTPTSAKLPPIKHVFVIVLADEPYAALFGPASQAHYLAGTLEKRGELLVRYYAVAHDELANGIALVSGQGPTAETAANCPTYADVQPASAGADQQVLGHGCVYPRSTETLAGQLAAKHLSWRAYVEDMSNAAGASTSCLHPTLGAADPTTLPLATATGPAVSASPPGPYATFRNPFMYFHGITDGAACAADDVGLTRLRSDLTSPARTPSLSYIVPSLCDDARPTPCAPGRPAGPAAADRFLRTVVPEILASKAYKEGGLLAITVDQAPASGVDADSSSCCGQPSFPALPAPAPLPGGGHLPPSGGGQVGALLLSPFVKAGTLNQSTYNHFALLRTIEDLFGLSHLGYAAASAVHSFDASVFDAKPPAHG